MQKMFIQNCIFHLKWKIEPKGPAALSDVRMIDLETANNTVEKCLEEMRKIKMFLKDENAWWKILKRRSMHCCQQKLPHLHGMLDGSLVTLLMFEDETNEVSLTKILYLTDNSGMR